MLHAQSLDLFGGLPGIRDYNLLDSAVNRPVNKWNYDQSTNLFVLAAAYGFGLAKNHAFNDGNKRIALLSIRAFLFVNGFLFNPDEVETVSVIEGLASGKVDERLLAEWTETNATKRRRR